MTITGHVGPNAITRMAEALQAREGEPARRLVFLAAGLGRYLAAPPEHMVPEAEVSALHAAAVDMLGPARAALAGVEAGRLTGDYLLARRIPAPAQALLRVLPRRWAAALLVRAIARHAWTFGGSGHFSYDWEDGLRLHLTDSPVCRDLRTGMPACDYLAATFERVFQAMLGPSVTVSEVECLSSGGSACTFHVRWAGGPGLTTGLGEPMSWATLSVRSPTMNQPDPALSPVRFQVEDMSCGHCEKTIRAALGASLPGAPVDVDLPGHLVTVQGPAAAAEAAIRDAGYTPVRV